MTTHPSLALEWQEDPDTPRDGVAKGALAWCGCGRRWFFAAGTATDTSGRRVNEVGMAQAALRAHRRQCPWPSVADVAPSEVVA